jgi:hypothetical protein
LFRCADKHTATSMWASSGSVIKILVHIKVSFKSHYKMELQSYNTLPYLIKLLLHVKW